MTLFVPLLRKLERQGASGTLTTATQVYEDTAREFKLIQHFLAARLNRRETNGHCSFMKNTPDNELTPAASTAPSPKTDTPAPATKFCRWRWTA